MPGTKKTGTTEDDLQKQRDELDDLRSQLAETQAERVAAETSTTNEIVSAQLAAERERLVRELAIAKSEAKATTAQGATGTLEQARAQMANAEAARKAVEDANKNQES